MRVGKAMNEGPYRRTRSMTPREQRLVKVCLELNTRLPHLVDQITAGGLADDDRTRLAGMFELIARDLRPTVVPPDDAGDAGSR